MKRRNMILLFSVLGMLCGCQSGDHTIDFKVSLDSTKSTYSPVEYKTSLDLSSFQKKFTDMPKIIPGDILSIVYGDKEGKEAVDYHLKEASFTTGTLMQTPGVNQGDIVFDKNPENYYFVCDTQRLIKSDFEIIDANKGGNNVKVYCSYYPDKNSSGKYEIAGLFLAMPR